MAQTVYRSKVRATVANREAVTLRACDLLIHLLTFDINLVSIVRDVDNFLIVTLSGPLPNAAQVDHLGLEGPI